jgi:cell wall-active antibiotic response 4TMS protein YvqF
MPDEPTDSTAPGSSGPAVAPRSPPPSATPDPGRRPGFEERIESFGREARAAGEGLGQRAEAAGERWSREPGVTRAADTAGRIWGLLLIAVGLWFFADVTLGLDMPSIPWRDAWPVGLIVIGLVVVLRGLGRRRA